jgi:hypothetical protein
VSFLSPQILAYPRGAVKRKINGGARSARPREPGLIRGLELSHHRKAFPHRRRENAEFVQFKLCGFLLFANQAFLC